MCAKQKKSPIIDKWEEENKWLYEKLAKKAVTAIERNNMTACYVPTQAEAKDRILEMIPEGTTVGWGGSVTLYNMGVLWDLQESGKYRCFNPFEGFVASPDERLVQAVSREPERLYQQMLSTLTTDYYLAGANAITMDGELVLIDGMGNRAAALLFGPKKVIVVAGANKIVKDYESAFRRIKDYAVGRTARMLGHDTPCTRTGYCAPAKGLDHCLHPHRICCATVRIAGQYDKDRINVFIIGEKLGF